MFPLKAPERLGRHVSPAPPAVLGIHSISEFDEPVNIGSSELCSVTELAFRIEEFADVTLRHVYQHDAPTGVPGPRGCGRGRDQAQT